MEGGFGVGGGGQLREGGGALKVQKHVPTY